MNKILLTLTAIIALFVLNVSAQLAVKGEIVWTAAGEPLTNGVVLISSAGKIEKVGTSAAVQIPSGYQTISAKVVTPGLIDAHTVVGLNGYLNQPHDQMALDNSAVVQPDLRAIDSYNAEERLIEWVRGFGVTTIHTGHQPSALISGQTMIAKTYGKTVESVVLKETAMIAVTLGESALAGQGRSPGTRAKQASILRELLLKAQNYKGEPRDLKMEMMSKVIKREIPLLVTAQRSQDLMTALRIAKEFNIRLVLDGAAEAYQIFPQIKESGFPVIVHPTQQRAGGDTENLSMETASLLKKSAIPFALQSGYEGYVPKTRVLLFEAGVAVANGLSPKDAISAMTIDSAKILGIENRVGSLEVGKDGDLALYDGDPFEYTTHCVGTVINGQVVSQAVR